MAMRVLGHAVSSSTCGRGCGQGRPAANPALTLTHGMAVGKAVSLPDSQCLSFQSQPITVVSGLRTAWHWARHCCPPQRCQGTPELRLWGGEYRAFTPAPGLVTALGLYSIMKGRHHSDIPKFSALPGKGHT